MTAGSITVPTIVPLRAPLTGKLKNVIDVSTPIELRTDSSNAEIYFTVDGSKPDPFAALGADRSTIKYTKPFKLREGKKTVKAIAISKDGTRESHVVTKCFEVEKSSSDNQENISNTRSDGYEFIDELERERKRELMKKKSILKKIVETNNMNSYRSDGGHSLSDNESSRYHKDTKFLGQRFVTKTMNFNEFNANQSFNKSYSTHFHDDNDLALGQHRNRIVLPDSSVQALRFQRETDFLKCIYCFASRPNDPHAKYCVECGKTLPQIPQAKLIPPQSGQMGTCFYCKSVVPFNTSICVICENPITPQLQPQASIKLQGKIICSNCSTSNPANYSSCVACEKKLTPSSKIHPVDLSMTVPQYPVPNGKSATCSQCFRLNRDDARFCDWCGAKPQKQLGPMQCGRCSASNNPYSKFCSTCGSLIQPPNDSNPNASRLSSVGQPTWLTNLDAKTAQLLNKQYSTASTQTYGIYYTSSKGLENKSEKDAKTIDKEFLERRPVLTAVSAGKGYWRQQMDHICAHLKAFSQNNSEFRVLVAEPKLGKINTARVDIDSSWCTITATFPIRNNTTKDSFNSSAIIHKALKNNSYLTDADYDTINAAVVNRDSSLSEESISEQEESYRSDSGKTKKKRRPLYKPPDDKLSGEDRQLFKELGKNRNARPKEVEFILKEGADPNAKTRDEMTPLHTAIRNRHFDCVPVLIEAGADLKATIPPKHNTVLHEAVLLGPEADNVLKLLLRNGANPSWKNKKNETAFDLAVKENNTVAINILGEYVGDSMMRSYLKNKSNDIKP